MSEEQKGGRYIEQSLKHSEQGERVRWNARNGIGLQSGKSIKMYGAENGIQFSENEPIPPFKEGAFSLSLELNRDVRTMTPLGAADSEDTPENSFLMFRFSLFGGGISELKFRILDDQGKLVYELNPSKTTVIAAADTSALLRALKQKGSDRQALLNKYKLEPAAYLNPGSYNLLWDGFDNNDVYDSSVYAGKKFAAEISGTKDGVTEKREVTFSMDYSEVHWVDVRIDRSAKSILATIRINLADEVDAKAAKSFGDLVSLALKGMDLYWGRNSGNEGKNVQIGGAAYQVFINPVNENQSRTMPALGVNYDDSKEGSRSRNWWASRKLFYNAGLYSAYPRLADMDFQHTAAHEIGHEILQAFGGKNNYSYIHKGSSTLLTQEVNKKFKYPRTGEIDLMIYYDGEDPTHPFPRDYYTRSVAAEKDVLGILWLTKLGVR